MKIDRSLTLRACLIAVVLMLLALTTYAQEPVSVVLGVPLVRLTGDVSYQVAPYALIIGYDKALVAFTG